jgi:serine/threonine protein kinase
LTEAGAVKVVDFGIARAAALSKLTQTGHVLGTAYYMSPEQAGGKPVSPRSDLYSLGVVLYEMLTGKLPYKADTASLIAANPTNGSLRPPKDVDPVIPDKLSDTVVRLLAHDPKERYQDASSLIANLERARGARPEGATTQPLSTVPWRAWTAYKSRTRNKTKLYIPPAPSAHPKKPVMKPLSELIMELIGHIGPRLRPLLGSNRHSGPHPLLFDRPFRGSRYKPAKERRPRKVLPRVLLTMFILMALLAVPNFCSQASISGTQERRANEPGGSAGTPMPLPGTAAPPSEFHQATEIPSNPPNDSGNSALPNLYDSSSYPSYQEPHEEVETQVEDLLEKIIRQ